MSCQVYFDTHGAVATMGDQDGVERSFKYVDATDYHKWRSCQEKFVGKASPSDVKQVMMKTYQVSVNNSDKGLAFCSFISLLITSKQAVSK